MDNPDTITETPLNDKDVFNNTIGMTLADAIREGSKLVPQKVGGWGDGVNNACAIHAAGIALKAKGYK